jgi:uncharacterized membrane protein YdbT with pleckstrin-like domain
MRGGGTQGAGRDVPEDELWSGTYSPKAMAGPMIGAAILTVLGLIAGSFFPPLGWMIAGGVAVVVWAWLILTLLYRQMTVRYRLTAHRFFTERGLLSRTNDRVQVIAIDDVRVRQGLIERMFDVGTIDLKSSDKEFKSDQGVNPELVLIGIESPQQVADLIDKARRAERNRRGLYMSEM